MMFFLGIESVSRRHYRARAMATWLKLIPKLHLSGILKQRDTDKICIQIDIHIIDM